MRVVCGVCVSVWVCVCVYLCVYVRMYLLFHIGVQLSRVCLDNAFCPLYLLSQNSPRRAPLFHGRLPQRLLVLTTVSSTVTPFCISACVACFSDSTVLVPISLAA
ncbi:unnamed protein product [Gadus morhua 'NCC']